jgi:hypothetical protein
MGWIRPGLRRCCARVLRRTRRCAIGTSAKDRKWESSAWVDWAIMAIKFAKAFGAHVVLFTTSPHKIAEAARLGADEVVVSSDAAAIEKQSSSFDFILDAVSADHDLNVYLKC